MEMSEIGARERFEAIAHSVRDVFWRSAGFIRARRASVKNAKQRLLSLDGIF